MKRGSLHGGLWIGSLLGQAGYPPEFGIHPGLDRDTGPFTFQDHAAHMDHVRPVAESRSPGDFTGAFSNTHGFAGELRFIDLETAGGQDPNICADPNAAFQDQDISGHDRGGGDLTWFSVPDDPGRRSSQFFQGVHTFSGFEFGVDLNYCNEQNEDEDRDRVADLPPYAVDDAYQEGDHDERFFEFRQEYPEK